MIQTQQLSLDTLLVELRGHFHSQMAKDLALLVFRSYRLGFRTFLFDLNQVSLADEKASQDLVRIEQGLKNKGGSCRVLGSHSSLENRLNFRIAIEQFPEETWN